jgi:hypothetical protein
MEERPFLSKKPEPNLVSLEQILGRVFFKYDQLMKIAEGFSKEWHHSASGGWMQKIADSKKVLFYLVPLHDQFLISLTVRESEREQLMNNKEMILHYDQLKQAKKYSEGYAMRFIVSDKESFSSAALFIKKLIALRK